MAVWTVFLCALVMVVSVAALRRGGDQQDAETFAGSGVQQLTEDDPPQPPTHHLSPAKKPRVKALLVRTAPVADPARPLAFHLRNTGKAPPTLYVPLPDDSMSGMRREDSLLRLHPGQAPPRVA
ncbi:hypothetical protein [Pseudoxanthomonas sp.]|uniref:hypothetical protein n=1 Tax=Pseudoxanthomonas sp. TaxID=1871049 RepID=UPI002FDF6A35